MRKRSLYIGLALLMLFGGWHAIYPGPYDPKGIHYVGWELHLLPMDSRTAISIMMHEVNGERHVLGKTREQLINRFGFVRSTADVDPYLREYCAAARPGREVLFLNASDVMVVMQNQHAVEVVLCKG